MVVAVIMVVAVGTTPVGAGAAATAAVDRRLRRPAVLRRRAVSMVAVGTGSKTAVGADRAMVAVTVAVMAAMVAVTVAVMAAMVAVTVAVMAAMVAVTVAVTSLWIKSGLP